MILVVTACHVTHLDSAPVLKDGWDQTAVQVHILHQTTLYYIPYTTLYYTSTLYYTNVIL